MTILDQNGRPFVIENTTLRDPDEWFVNWLTGGGGGTAAGIAINQHTALKCAAVYACVRNLGEDVAKLPLLLYERLEGGGKARASNNPLYHILHDRPNAEMSSFVFRRAVTKDAALCGNGYAEIVRNAAGVVEDLHYIENWRVTPKRRKSDGSLYYEVNNGTGIPVPLRADEMFHIPGLGDGQVGYTTFRLADESIAGCLAADEYSGSFFGNDATPAFFVKHPQKLNAESLKNLKASFEEHTGARNSHKTAILEEGMDVTKLSIDPNVAQMVESRQHGVDDIARWFRMPPHKIQHLLRSTYSNIEQQSLEYVNDTLMPWLVCWEQEIQRKLIPPSRRKDLLAEHLVTGLLRGDQAARSAFYREMHNIGALSRNEIREFENMNPVEDGNQYFINATMVPVKQAIELADKKVEQAEADIEQTKNPPEPVVAPPAPENITASCDLSMQATEAAELAAKSVSLMLAKNIDAALPVVRQSIEEKLAKALSTEAYHVEKLSKKPDALNKVVEFYSGHQDKLESSLTTTVTVAAHCLWMALGKGAICSTLDGAVKDHVTKMTARHVARSKAKQDFSPERAVQDAKAEADSLLELVANYEGAIQ